MVYNVVSIRGCELVGKAQQKVFELTSRNKGYNLSKLGESTEVLLQPWV